MTDATSAAALECAKDIRQEMMRMVFMGDGELTLPAGHLAVMAQHVQRFSEETSRAAFSLLREIEATLDDLVDHPCCGWGPLLTKVRAVLAALPSPPPPVMEAQQWRPIESAPQAEVCDFWLEWADDIAAHDGQKPLGQSGWAHDQRFRGHFGGWSSVYKATHWMPLPSPPQEGKP